MPFLFLFLFILRLRGVCMLFFFWNKFLLSLYLLTCLLLHKLFSHLFYAFCHDLPATYSASFFSITSSFWSPHISPYFSYFSTSIPFLFPSSIPPPRPPPPPLHPPPPPSPPSSTSSGINCVRLTSLH